ncbi:MAG TPA: molybdate ABC transporter substrate-binding protein [Xanthobacteraceae bacterium]|jgi:molybdate transport system substrate-binding protein
MRFHRLLAALAAGSLLFIVGAQASELKVSASTAVKSVLEQLGPQFEKTNGNKVTFSFGPAATLKEKIDQGAAFDVAILTAPLTDALVKAGKVDATTRATIARAGLGVSVRAGAAKPDVSTDEGLKRALLNAKSIGYNGVGASRAASEAMLRKLGIADAIQPKIKLLGGSAPVAVANGEVEIGLGPVSEILPIEGAQLAGPFPSDLQSYLVFSAGVSTESKNQEAATVLIKFLASPAAAPVLKDKGMQPG